MFDADLEWIHEKEGGVERQAKNQETRGYRGPAFDSASEEREEKGRR